MLVSHQQFNQLCADEQPGQVFTDLSPSEEESIVILHKIPKLFWPYSKFGFSTLINSKSISIFYLLLYCSTATWNYSFSFAFKAQIIYNSDFTKNKIFHAF